MKAFELRYTVTGSDGEPTWQLILDPDADGNQLRENIENMPPLHRRVLLALLEEVTPVVRQVSEAHSADRRARMRVVDIPPFKP